MSVLMGGDFWSAFGEGAISGGVSSYLGSKTKFTGHKFLDGIKRWFYKAFGQFAGTGKYEFKASDALALCGAGDAISEALSTALNPPGVDFDDVQWVDEYGNPIDPTTLNVQQASFTSTDNSGQDNYKVAIKLITASGDIISGTYNVVTGTIVLAGDPTKLGAALATGRIAYGGYKIVKGVRTFILEIKSIGDNPSSSGGSSGFGGAGSGGGWGAEYEAKMEQKIELFKWGFGGIMKAWDNGRLSKDDAWGAVVIWSRFLNDVFDFGNEGYIRSFLYDACVPKL